jgi:hypothetical protein
VKKIIRYFLSIFLLAIITLYTFLSVSTVRSQSSNGWSTPLNLSNSGSASDPVIVADSLGLIHVLWMDEFSGFVYVLGDGTQWSDPRTVDVPFEQRNSSQGFEKVTPSLLADQFGTIHAFWREDEEGSLYYSRVAATEFGSFASWTEPLLLDFSALDFDVEIDESGDIHLGYIRQLDTPDNPSGVYYYRLSRETGLWSFPILLYPSKYFRSVGLENSNIDIATSEVDGNLKIFVAWDNRSRQRVYLTKSLDAGETWEAPEVIDRPDSTSGTVNPMNILVSGSGEDLTLLWQRRDSVGNCTHLHQWSNDNGETWSQPEQMLAGARLCGQESRLFTSGDGRILLWTIVSDQVHLLAWDQDHWSEPRVQPELSTLEDPETLNAVTLGCRQATFLEDGSLAVVGCEASGDGDIWFTQRDLLEVGDWFSSEKSWSRPSELLTSTDEFQSPVLISGPENLLHVFWSQVDVSEQDFNRTVIYYLGGNGEQWGQPVKILHSPQGNAKDPSAALNANGRILVVWSESRSGGIYFSWANATRANIATEWSTPTRLPVPQAIVHSPKILIDNTGTIHVIYSVPINEGRGIYGIRSRDGGETWLSPTFIFDAAGAGFEMVDRPQLAQSPDGVLHALWIRTSIPEAGGILGLYYVYSEDGGETWSPFEEVAAGNITWSQISSDGGGVAYRFWQEEINRQPVIKFQRRQDNGITWEPPESLSSFGESLRIAKLVSDPSGNLQMLQIVQDSAGRLILRNWVWEEERWVVSENLDLSNDAQLSAYSMVTAVSPPGKLNLVYFTKKGAALNDEFEHHVLFTSRSLRTAPGGQEPQQDPETTALPAEIDPGSPNEAPLEITPPATEVLPPTQMPDLSSLEPVEITGSGNESTISILVGVMLSGLVIFTVLGFGIWRVRRGS